MDVNEIRKWHSVFKRDDELFEIRVLGDKTFSGYFYDVDIAIKELEKFDNCNIYYTINEVKTACASRDQFNTFRMVRGTATSKQDIEHRWWLAIDLDCERPSGVSSTDEEKKRAYDKAQVVYRFLRDNGFFEPVVCDSSSGYHILYPIDMPNTQESEDCIKEFLEILAGMFTDEYVKIDTVLHDANRILRLPGTFGRKGRSTESRPHRLAHILCSPKDMQRMTMGHVMLFNDKFRVVPEATQQRTYGNYMPTEQFDLRKFIADHGLKVAKEMPYGNGGTKFVLEECPFDSGHKAPDSAIFQTAQGAIGFKCLHNSCSHHDWHELRLKLDPTAYERKERPTAQPLPVQREYAPIPQRPKYEIKDVVPELGEKWLSMSSIKKIDISALEHYKTGFTELDRHILGLFMGEVTLLSGSNSSGKTSWLNSLILNLIDQGAPTALWSGELPAPILKSWISMVAAGKRNLSPSQYNDGKFFVPNNVSEKIDRWLDGRLFIYNNDYGNNWKQLFHDMELLVKCGVKFFVLDNLFSMNIDLLGTDNNSRQKELILQIKEFAKKNQVHIILVAHPRKTMAFLRKNDISGTSDLGNAVDDIFIIHRVNNDFFRAGADFFGKTEINRFQGFGNVIEVAKNRMFGAVDLMVGMHYEIESRRFKNAEYEDKQYGWERMGYEQTSIETPTPDVSYHEPRHETAVFKGDAPIDTGVPFAPPAMDDEPPF